jgi:hypothetical protein
VGSRTTFEILAQPFISMYKWRKSELARKRASMNQNWTIAGYTSRWDNDTKIHPMDTLARGGTPTC